MLEPLADLPEGVLGYHVSGELTAADYDDVLIPAVQAAREAGEGVRMVLHVPELPSFTAGAMWDDARMGFSNYTQWKRIAFVTDVSWMRKLIDASSFLMPGQMRGFPVDQMERAVAWAATRDGGLNVALTTDEPPVAVLEPGGRLTEEDFADAAAAIDPAIEVHGGLAGILIAAERFPGWDSFGALAAHMRFVKGHHEKLRRVAVCTDGGAAQKLPGLAKHFVAAEIRAFPLEEREAAMSWLREPA